MHLATAASLLRFFCRVSMARPRLKLQVRIAHSTCPAGPQEWVRVVTGQTRKGRDRTVRARRVLVGSRP